jgi:hypothetical protein
MKRSLLLLVLLIPLAACVQQPPVPQRTQLEMREIQTRSYPSKDIKMVMKAVINALQDEGFVIRNADKELGFISASRELDVEDRAEVVFSTIFGGDVPRYKKSSQMEASVNVSEFGRDTRVRVIFQTKILDNYGAPLTSHQVSDPFFYQNFFSKMDKSLFIEKEQL